MIRVMVADDHAVVRRGVVQILADSDEVHVVAEASTAREVIQRARDIDCDVLLLDIAFPDGSGLDVLNHLRLSRPAISTVMLSIYPEAQYAIRAFMAGASGYLTKESAPEELLTAIRKVSRGERYVTPSLAEKLAGRLGPDFAQEPHETLSDREDQVMRLLAAGQSVGDIAAQLSLSVKTVSTYRARTLVKLGLESTAEIMRYALERGLVP